MRVKLSKDNLQRLFSDLELHEYGIPELSKALGLHARTITDWKHGKFNMPIDAFEEMASSINIATKIFNPEYIDETEQRRRAGIIGGRAQWQKNGSIGSFKDKVAGGRASYAARKEKDNDIFSRIKILNPRMSSDLAEFIGISMGDGSITNYQVAISLNNEDDKQFICYVAELSERLFGVRSFIQKSKRAKCSNVILSSVELVEFLISLGLPKGDKIRAKLDLPGWIKADLDFSRWCIRGLFDTDGSIFLETHTINGKKYSYPRMSFVSASEPLRESVYEVYLQLGLNPKIRMERSVNLEQITDIDKYFKIVGSSNQKHLQRFAKFGGVG